MKSLENMFSMMQIHKDNKVFQNNQYAINTTDICFKLAKRPPEVQNEIKKYYCKKHGLYGFKSEATALPNGICVFAHVHEAGRNSDIKTLR